MECIAQVLFEADFNFYGSAASSQLFAMPHIMAVLNLAHY
jgi:hypothetical protein